MKSLYIWIAVIVILIGGLIWYLGSGSGAPSANVYQPAPASNSATSTYQSTGSTTASSTPAPATTSSAPEITSLTPASGPAGTTVTIHGQNFSKSWNYILFGSSSGRRHPDGSPDNSYAKAASPDGTTLTFTIPASGPSGILCSASNQCVGITAIRLTPGQYPVQVRDSLGTSNAVSLTLSQ